jgi:hypothetical protein
MRVSFRKADWAYFLYRAASLPHTPVPLWHWKFGDETVEDYGEIYRAFFIRGLKIRDIQRLLKVEIRRLWKPVIQSFPHFSEGRVGFELTSADYMCGRLSHFYEKVVFLSRIH